MDTFTGRLIKTETEIENLRGAARLSSRVHRTLMRTALAGRREDDVRALIEDGFRAAGMDELAYATLVGAGERSALIHARATDRVIREGDLVVVDAGGKWKGYCADITRTLPAGRRFTGRQRQIYEIVLNAQKRAIAHVKPGRTLPEIEAVTRESLAEGLRGLGYSADEIRENLARWMPHKTSHWLGRDVHDPCPYVDEHGAPVRLRAGMVFTVEPGLYFGEGVRIEDDVVVTADGCEVLTDVPKEVDEIHELRSV